MIWWILGYVFMGTIGHLFLTGVIIGIAAIKRGYRDNAMEIIEYVEHFSNTRRDESIIRFPIKNVFGYLIRLTFGIITWPVEFIRVIFLDIPDSIELYESRHGIERL